MDENNIHDKNLCIFKDILDCKLAEDSCETEMTEVRKQKAIQSSLKRKDGLHTTLESVDNIRYHKNCYLQYTSNDHIARYLKRKGQEESSNSAKRTRRSTSTDFDFKHNCLICGEFCNIIPDKKHPDRWKKNKGFLCRTADRGKGKLSFKDTLLQKCDERGDSLGDQVRLRVAGACSDLHAAEARYHEKCLQLFENPKEIQSAQRDHPAKSPEQSAIRYIARSIRNSPDKTWTSLELHKIYQEKGGCETNRHRFISNLCDHMKTEIYIFASPGIASIIMLKEKASSLFKLVSDTDDDDDDVAIQQIAKKINTEVKAVRCNNKEYAYIDKSNLFDECSSTLLTLLNCISPIFCNNLAAAMIANIVTSMVTKRFTQLQLSLGVLARDKKLIEHLHEYGITCTYHEVRRFKISAAVASDDTAMNALDSSNGLIQVISDNFDAHVHSQNGLKETHSLATIVTQPLKCADLRNKQPFARLRQEQLKSVKIKDTEMKYFKGQKNPPMPASFCCFGVLPLKVLSHQAVSLAKSQCDDYCFLQSSLSMDNSADYNGYNTRRIREAGVSMKPKSAVKFLPLIDKTPSDPSTILTAMCEAEKITNTSGQEITVFTSDQQLYKICLDIVWSDTVRWKNFCPRIGGMHWIMSFVGCVGVLMENTGLTPWLKSAFAGVEKMLLGKKFPMNVRALRFVVLELLRGFMEDVCSFSDLECKLDQMSKKSVITEHWVENLIKPVFLMMLYIRAEREGEFPLHLFACKKMLPYFFAAGHINYARYGLCYLFTMSKLPTEVLDQFMLGDHVLRHQQGLWNGIWSDMMIETSYMKYGKGPSGVIGKTTKPRTIQIWAKSQHSCSEVLRELDSIRGKSDSFVNTHKEELVGRIQSDEIDRKKLQDFLSTCIHPLDFATHSSNVLCNIYTGQTSEKSVNVNKSVEIGKRQLREFQESLPEGFRSPITKSVITMKESKKNKKKKVAEVYNTEIIFSRVMYLLSSGQIEIKDLFSYELSPVPTSLFKESGEGRYPTSKATLKNELKVEVSIRNVQTDAVLIDGCAMLHSAIHWPKGGKVEDLIAAVRNYILKKLSLSDVYLIFDRYRDFSIKSDTRIERLENFRRSHNLAKSSPLPAKEITLKISKTKIQLIEMISKDLLENVGKRINKLIVTAQQDKPEQLHHGNRVEREDLKTLHEEADVIIPLQVASAISDHKRSIKVLCEDTDVFALLCHCYYHQNWDIDVYMEGFSEGKSVISIKQSVEQHRDLIPSLLSTHALSGCDTVPMMFGIGKKKALTASKRSPLHYLGQCSSTPDQYMSESKRFIATCYGGKSSSSSQNRESIWRRRTEGAKITSKPPPLKALPPTDPALELNILRARYQRLVWGSCLENNPPDIDPCEFGWKKDEQTKTLRPVMIANDIKAAPDEVLRVNRCNCTASQCKTLACSCSKARIPCSDFCGCEDKCQNRWNISGSDSESDTEESSDEETD